MNFVAFAFLLSLAGPLFLIPVEKVFPYPWLVEELFKLIVVWLILKSKPEKNYLVLAVSAGFLFAFSETIFYLANIFVLGNLWLVPKRLVLTSFLHSGTILLMAIFGKKGGWRWAIGFWGTFFIHWFFNEAVASVFTS